MLDTCREDLNYFQGIHRKNEKEIKKIKAEMKGIVDREDDLTKGPLGF